jgi:hypothetical protein
MSAKHYRIPIGTLHASVSEMTPTFKDLLDFVMANRRGYMFKDMTEEQIAFLLQKGISEQSMYFEQGLDGKIAGMILAEFIPEKKLCFVTFNMAMSLDRLGRFAAKLKTNHPDFTIAGVRHGRAIYYNTKKLYRKLL